MLQFDFKEVVLGIGGALAVVIGWVACGLAKEIWGKFSATMESVDKSLKDLTITMAGVLEWRKASDKFDEMILRRVEKLEERE